jgi:hypothetical protein
MRFEGLNRIDFLGLSNSKLNNQNRAQSRRGFQP